MRHTSPLLACCLLLAMLGTGCGRTPAGCGESVVRVDPQQAEPLPLPDGRTATELRDAEGPLLLGSVTNAWIQGGKWIVVSTTGAYLFDPDGRLVAELAKKGRAAHEYVTLWDAWPEADGVTLFDSNGKKLLRYDLNGKFVGAVPLERRFGEAFQNLRPLGNGAYVGKQTYQGRPTPELALYDREYRFVRTIGTTQFDTGMRFNYPFGRYGDRTLYCNSLRNAIYAVDDAGAVRLRYTVDFGPRNLPADRDDGRLVETILQEKDHRRYALLPANVCEDDDRLLFTYIYDRARNVALYDKTAAAVRLLRIEPPQGFVLTGVVALTPRKLALFLSDDHATRLQTVDLE